MCNASNSSCLNVSSWKTFEPVFSPSAANTIDATNTTNATNITNTTATTILPGPALAVKHEDVLDVGIVVGISILVVAAFIPSLALAIWLYRSKISSCWSTGVKAIKGESLKPEAPVMPVRQWEMPDMNVVRGPNGSLLTGHTFQEWQGGGTYEGQVKQGLRDGEGRMVWPDGKIYIGQWNQGTPHGHGLWHAPGERGWTYNGQFQQGQRHGNGRCESFERKVWYDGEWRNGFQNGMGENGSLANLDDCVQSGRIAPPPVAHIWWMEQGEQKEHISVSKVAPESWDLTDVVLNALPEDFARLDAMKNTVGQLQLVSRLWGVSFGVPESWLSTSWGALTITQIMEGGPLWRWSMDAANEFGSDAFTIHPNAMIWRVNSIMGDVDQMVREICACHGRRRVYLGISNPPHIRFPRQQPLLAWGERPSANPFARLPSPAIPAILDRGQGVGGQTVLAIADLEVPERSQGDVPRALNPDLPDSPPLRQQPAIRPRPNIEDRDEPVRGQIDLPDDPKATVAGVSNAPRAMPGKITNFPLRSSEEAQSQSQLSPPAKNSSAGLASTTRSVPGEVTLVRACPSTPLALSSIQEGLGSCATPLPGTPIGPLGSSLRSGDFGNISFPPVESGGSAKVSKPPPPPKSPSPQRSDNVTERPNASGLLSRLRDNIEDNTVQELVAEEIGVDQTDGEVTFEDC